jgi:hypothetical protein
VYDLALYVWFRRIPVEEGGGPGIGRPA